MKDVSRQHIIDRVTAGRAHEVIAIEKLKEAGWKVTASSNKQDRIDKIDCFLNGKAAQIKTRATGDDVIIEVYKPYAGLHSQNNKPGRDTKGSYTLYILANDKGNPKVYNRREVSKKISAILEECGSDTDLVDNGRSQWYRGKEASICIKEDNRDKVRKMLIYIKTDALTEIYPMKTSSAKAKGRALQQKIRDMYREVGKKHGLQDADIESRGMGQQGVDLILSPAAQRLLNHDIECKKHAQVKIPAEFNKHYKKYKDRKTTLKLLYSENNNSEPLVTMRAVDFMTLVKELLPEPTSYDYEYER